MTFANDVSEYCEQEACAEEYGCLSCDCYVQLDEGEVDVPEE